MKSTSIITLSTFVALAASAPTPQQAIPTVEIRLIGFSNTQYTPSTQNPSGERGHVLSLPANTVFRPGLIQGVEVVDDTSNVVCLINVKNDSTTLMVTKTNGQLMLDHGKYVEVTEMSCGPVDVKIDTTDIRRPVVSS